MTVVKKIVAPLVVICALALTPACKKKDEGGDAPETETVETETPTEPETAEVEPEVSEDEIPVPEDFEEESEQQITTENYEAELDKLASEIEG